MSDYFRRHVRYQPLDQVNLIFRGPFDFNHLLIEALRVLDNENWTQDPQDHEYLLEFDDRLRYEVAWRTSRPIWDRYHVRFWRGHDHIIASAHRERAKLWHWPPFVHEVESFDDGKRKVEDMFRRAGWTVQQDANQMGAPIEDPPASGWASIIVHP